MLEEMAPEWAQAPLTIFFLLLVAVVAAYAYKNCCVTKKTDDQKTVPEMVEEQDLDVDGLDIDTESLKL